MNSNKKSSISGSCVVSFLDILGFKNTLGSTPHETDKAFDLLRKLRRESPHGQQEHAKGVPEETICFAMSDALVRVTPVSLDGALHANIIELVHILMETIPAGFFLRGGVSAGYMRADLLENLIVGKPLAKAYELEQKFAIYPRIILDQSLG